MKREKVKGNTCHLQPRLRGAEKWRQGKGDNVLKAKETDWNQIMVGLEHQNTSFNLKKKKSSGKELE